MYHIAKIGKNKRPICTKSLVLIRKSYVVLLIALAASIAVAKDRIWLAATVTAIEHIPARVMRNNASTDYTVQAGGTSYTLEDSAATYYTGPPKDLLAIGETVELSLDGGKHAFVKAPGFQKRFRLVRSAITGPTGSLTP